MLSKLTVGNFKAFKDVQEIPLRPITLVFGANSSGKSSLLHAILLLHHGVTTGHWSSFHTTLGGDGVDLGGLANFAHCHDTNKSVQLGAEVKEGKLDVIPANPNNLFGPSSSSTPIYRDVGVHLTLDPAAGMAGRSGEFLDAVVASLTVTSGARTFFEAEHPTPFPEHDISVYDLKSLDLRAPFLLDVMDHSHNNFPVEVEGNEGLSASGGDIIRMLDGLDTPAPLVDSITERLMEHNLALQFDRQLRSSRDARESFSHELAQLEHDASKVTLDLSLRGSGTIAHLLWTAVEQAAFYVQPLLRSALDRLDYLGPLRVYPGRRGISATSTDFLREQGGMHAWEAVLRDPLVRSSVNRWLGSDLMKTGYRFSEQKQYSQDDVLQAFNLMAGNPMRDFPDALERVPPTARNLVLTDLRSGTLVNHRDIGVGISQVLPILVSAFGSDDRQIIMEQPELHLHPALQARLGDVFIESANRKGGNQFIIETHSEHLILRMLRRIRETAEGSLQDHHLALRPEDIAVLYVESTPSGSRVLDLRVSEDGEFIDSWPDGFFPERAEELF